ncbi:hypothetical protein F5887DRAFT_873525 [Amanita rubescens]|nr:hypothetical protein F5887DRAFT_873525 [Amanita rubescens]
MADRLEEPVRLYASYPFDTDDAFKKGLENILASAALSSDNSPGSRDDIERRARVFYFSSRVTGYPFTIEQALAAEQTRSTPSSQEDQTEEDYVLTFAELQELIAAGQVEGIPNNKVILDGLNEAQPSTSVSPVRKKPWEIAVSDQVIDQSMA